MYKKSKCNTRNSSSGKDIPSVREVQELFYLKGLSTVEAWQFINFYELNGWKNSKGERILKWKLAAARWTDMIRTRYPHLVQPQSNSDALPAKSEIGSFYSVQLEFISFSGSVSIKIHPSENKQ